MLTLEETVTVEVLHKQGKSIRVIAQDFVRPAKLPILALQLLEPVAFLALQAAATPLVTLGLAHPHLHSVSAVQPVVAAIESRCRERLP